MRERTLVLIAEGSFSSSLAFLITAILFGIFSISIPEELKFAKYSVLGSLISLIPFFIILFYMRGWTKLRK